MKIIAKKIDYLKFVVYRERKRILKDDEVPCPVVAYFKKEFNLDIPEDTKIFNKEGLGINSGYRTKVLIDLRSEFFLRHSLDKVIAFLDFIKTKNLISKNTRIDVCVDYLNEQMLPFQKKKSHFGKIHKGTILIPEKFRGDLSKSSEWMQMNCNSSKIFYDKSKEIRDNKNKEKAKLYPEIYHTSQVYRFELKLKNPKIIIDENTQELQLVESVLKDFYLKNKFSNENQKIFKIFGI